jgi:photosystem II stability/assembly factor-like uncharacterized protein
MRTESELRSEFRSALEAVTPPAPWLAHAVKKGLGTRPSTRRADWAPLQLRFGLNVVAILVVIGLAVAAVGVYLTVHQAVVPAHPPTGRVFLPTKMVTASTGWAWVDPGSPELRSELWRTTDGGAHWTNVTAPSVPDRLSPYTETHYLMDATHAWIAESGQGTAGSGGPYITTFRTTDGGKTWHEGASIGGLSPLSSSPQLFFLDQNHGWLLRPTEGSAPKAQITLYSTDDAGVHWKLTSSGAWPVQPINPMMVFSSLTTGWILGTNGSLLVTHDGGVTWQVQPLPITPDARGGISSPKFFDPQHGQIVAWASSSSSVVLLVTSDGGSTWVVRSLPGEFQWLAGNFVDANHGWAVAGQGPISSEAAVDLPLYKTDDGGLTWVPVLTNILFTSPEGPIGFFFFVDSNNGFAVRYDNRFSGFSQLLKTTDGGRTWTVVVEALQTP